MRACRVTGRTTRATGTWSIRPAAAADLPGILGIYAPEVEEGTATFELTPPDLAEMGRRMSAVRELGWPWLVADRDGSILGYASAGPYRVRPAYRWTVENAVYAARGARGQGIGRALLQRLLLECERAGARQMVAIIGDSANLASIALHRACGFRDVGTLGAVGFKLGLWLDTVIMQHELGAGASRPPSR